MRAHQDIEFSSQVTGALLPPGARQASIIEQLRHTLVTSLFSPPGNEPGSGGVGLDFERCLARFRAEMTFAARVGPKNRLMLERLGIADDADGVAWPRLYVMGLSAVATVVSQFEYGCLVAETVAREGDVGQDDVDEDEVGEDEVAEPLPGAREDEAYRLLAHSLRSVVMSPAVSSSMTPAEGEGVPPNPLAVARAAVQAVIASTGDCFEAVPRQIRSTKGQPRDVRCIIVSSEVLERLLALTRRLPHLFTLQPLCSPPSYRLDDSDDTKPDPQTTTRHNLLDWKISTPFLRKFAATCHQPEFLAALIAAVNAQQAVEWRVNRRLMEWVRVMAWLDTVSGPTEMPAWLESFSEPVRQAVENLRTWPPEGIQIRRLLEAKGSDPATGEEAVLLRSRRSSPLSSLTKVRESSSTARNPLDNPLVSSVFASLGLNDEAREPNEQDTFFLAWFADFRGRIYVDTPWFSPQGADIQRAMLEFGQGQVLNESGRRALKRHGGGLARRTHVLKDLGITGRSVVTFEERERWVDMHRDQIRASAKNPLEHTFWYHASADPLQFLAFCLEWDRQASDPTAPCHLPVQVDGSCSGLQHMSALTSSRSLALAVNVEGRGDALPADIYSDLAETVKERLLSFSEEALVERMNEKSANKAQAYLLLRERVHWINRDTAKKVVMTVPYGAGSNSQRKHVLDSLIENLCPLGKEDADALDALGRRILTTSKGPSAADADRVDHETAVWWGLSRLAFYIAVELRKALSEKYPAVVKFEQTVSAIGEAILLNRGTEGSLPRPDHQDKLKPDLRVPLAWPAPSGVAAVQPKFNTKQSTVSIKLKTKSESVSVKYDEHLPQVDIAKQINGLMPNLIHSLDATHLNRTIRTITKRGIVSFGTIHDCIQCLPNDLEAVAEVLRDQFARLYESDPDSCLPKVLVEWYEWMSLMHEVVRVPKPKKLPLALAATGAIAVEGERARIFGRDGLDESRVPDALIERIKGLSPMRRAIMNCLVDALHAEPLHTEECTEKTKQFPGLDAFRDNSDDRLDLSRVRESEYFFS